MLIFIEEGSGDFSSLQEGDRIIVDIASDMISFERGGRTMRMKSHSGFFEHQINSLQDADKVAKLIATLSEVEITLLSTSTVAGGTEDQQLTYIVKQEN